MTSAKPSHLIKFCSAQAAEQILNSATLRWSSPSVFADTMELSHTSTLSFDCQALLENAIKISSGMIFAKQAPQGDTPIINAIRRWREDGRFSSPDEADHVLRELLSKMVNQRFVSIEKLLKTWGLFTRNLRICCFTERPNNTIAWQQFGDNHRGVALRFECAEGSTFKDPKAVEYDIIRPEITTLKEQLGVLINNTPDVSIEKFALKFARKPKINKAEEEWRCLCSSVKKIAPDSEDCHTWYDDIKFEHNDLSAAYFGLETDEAVKKQCITLIKKNFKHAKLYQAHFVKGKYDIEFERIS